MQRSDYSFQNLTDDQYEQIVTASEKAMASGHVSPMHGQGNYDGLIRESTAFNVDPRLALAWTHWEGHDGTDPHGGIALAQVYNFGGIIYTGQPGAYRSSIMRPPAERKDDPDGQRDSSYYAGFSDFGGFVHELYCKLTDAYCGPYFAAGDLTNAASMYIRGKANSGVGQERVDTFVHYQHAYPPAG
jgi:hypothetical protein